MRHSVMCSPRPGSTTARIIAITRAVLILGGRNANSISPTARNANSPKTSSSPLAPVKHRPCTREHLTDDEVRKLIQAAKGNRRDDRDATMVLIAYRHGLRASELCDLRWEQIDLNSATLHVRRAKNGKPSTHPLRGDELRALRKLERTGGITVRFCE